MLINLQHFGNRQESLEFIDNPDRNSGHKISKKRYTITTTIASNGDILPAQVIHKYMLPRAVKQATGWKKMDKTNWYGTICQASISGQ